MRETTKSAEKAVRQRRLSVALRENLKRRKAQARGRQAGTGVDQVPEPHDSAEIAEDKPSGVRGS